VHHARLVDLDVVDQPDVDDVEVQLGVLYGAERLPDRLGVGSGVSVMFVT
jgi:hypothetical protein